MKKESTKQMLFEMMQKVNPDFKNKISEEFNWDDIYNSDNVNTSKYDEMLANDKLISDKRKAELLKWVKFVKKEIDSYELYVKSNKGEAIRAGRNYAYEAVDDFKKEKFGDITNKLVDMFNKRLAEIDKMAFNYKTT